MPWELLHFPSRRDPFSPKGYVGLINDYFQNNTPFAGSVFEILIKVIDLTIDIFTFMYF